MAIGLGAALTNQATAQLAQLAIEYDPHPPLGNLDWASFDRAALAPLMDTNFRGRHLSYPAGSASALLAGSLCLSAAGFRFSGRPGPAEDIGVPYGWLTSRGPQRAFHVSHW